MKQGARPLFLLAAALAACQNPPAPSSSGEAYYQTLNCRVCHRIGEDGGNTGPDLTLVGFRKSRAWLDLWMKDPQAWKADTLMPNSRLSDKARGALVDYLSSLKGQSFAGGGAPWNAPKLKSDPLERGHAIYSRAGCIACHGKGGAGGYPNSNVPGGNIPALNAVSETYTKDELKKKITRGSVPVKADLSGPEPLISMPAWGQVLKDDEIDAVSDYLFSLKGGASKDTQW